MLCRKNANTTKNNKINEAKKHFNTTNLLTQEFNLKHKCRILPTLLNNTNKEEQIEEKIEDKKDDKI